MTHSADDLTVRDAFRAQGLDLSLIKFGRLVGNGSDDPLGMTLEEFRRAAIGGRALDALDHNFIGFEQQYQRVCKPLSDEPSLKDLHAYMVDLETSLVFLMRLRRAAVLLMRNIESGASLVPAIERFDTALPDLKHLRDTAEHFDDYILGKGRHKPKSGAGRQYGLPGKGAPVISRDDRRVDLGVASGAARELYKEIYAAVGHHPHLLD